MDNYEYDMYDDHDNDIYDEQMAEWEEDEEDLRRMEHDMRVDRERQLWLEPDDIDSVGPLTAEEQQLYQEYVIEEKRRKREEERKRQRILEQREIVRQREIEQRGAVLDELEMIKRNRMKSEIDDWKRSRGIELGGIPTMPLHHEYKLMIDTIKKEEEEKRNIEYVERQNKIAKARKQERMERERLKPNKQNVITPEERALEKEKRRHQLEEKRKRDEENRRLQWRPQFSGAVGHVIRKPEKVEEVEVVENVEIPTPVKKRVKMPKNKGGEKTLHLAEFINKDTNPECRLILKYSWNSKNVPAGEGPGEQKGFGDNLFKLNRVKDWRKKLSNLWKAPFVLDGKKWQTVEHYVQSRKFDHYPKYANEFSMDSGSVLSTYPIMAKFAGTSSGRFFKNKKIEYARPRHIKPREDFRKDSVSSLILATYSKFSQNEHLYRLLDDTNDACLFRVDKGKSETRALWLETVRKCLRMMRENQWEIEPLSSKMLTG